jgi:hypothetical protein
MRKKIEQEAKEAQKLAAEKKYHRIWTRSMITKTELSKKSKIIRFQLDLRLTIQITTMKILQKRYTLLTKTTQ